MKVITIIAMSMLLSFGTAAIASQHESQEPGQHKQCAHKGGKHGKMGHKRAMHHANPMPSLMMVVMKKSAELNLTPEQEKALAAWRDQSNPVFKDQVSQVMKLENEIMQASLDGVDKAALMSKVDEMLAIRRSIAERKVNCRDNMKKILNEEQYNRVIKTYREHRAEKQQKMMNH